MAFGGYMVNSSEIVPITKSYPIPPNGMNNTTSLNITYDTIWHPYTGSGTLIIIVGWALSIIGVVINLHYLVKKGVIWQKK